MRKTLVALAAIFLVLGSAPGNAQSQASEGLHMEVCTEWRGMNGDLYTRNVCRRTVMIWFMTLDGRHHFVRTLERNQPFDTGIRMDDAKELGWIGATCPTGFKPDVEFTPQNRERFINSDYDCVRG